MSPEDAAAHAREVHREAFVVDAHHDILLDVLHGWLRGRTDRFTCHWLPKLRQGGVKLQLLPVFLEDRYLPDHALSRSLLMLEAVNEEADRAGCGFAVVRTVQDLDACVQSGLPAVLLSMEGAEPLGPHLPLLRLFHRLGLRSLGLTWNRRTALADGLGVEHGAGLTPLGRDAVALCDELGVLLDLAHLNRRGFDEVLDLATRPVIVSHANARALCDDQRNLTDEQLRAVAAAGGVTGVVLYGPFVDRYEYTLDRVVDHICHISSVCGIEHVGIGTDFLEEISEDGAYIPDGLGAIPSLSRIEHLPNLTEAMFRRGLSDGEVRAVLGENFLRVLRQTLPQGRD